MYQSGCPYAPSLNELSYPDYHFDPRPLKPQVRKKVSNRCSVTHIESFGSLFISVRVCMTVPTEVMLTLKRNVKHFQFLGCSFFR